MLTDRDSVTPGETKVEQYVVPIDPAEATICEACE